MNVAKLKSIAILRCLSSEYELVSATVDFIKPFLFDSVYREFHAVCKVSPGSLELNFNFRDRFYGFYKFERLEVSGWESSHGYLLEQSNGFDYIAFAGGIGTVNHTDFQRRNIIALLCPADMGRVDRSLAGNEAYKGLFLEREYVLECCS